MPKLRRTKPTYSFDAMRDGVSQSFIQTLQDCPEKARLNVLLGWTPKSLNRAFCWGTLSHGAIEATYRAQRDGKKCDLDTAMKISEKAYWLEHKNPTTQHKDMFNECYGEVKTVLTHYFKFWQKQDSEVEWVLVEDDFKVQPYTQQPPMRGKFDAVFKRKGKVWLFETKNKSQWPENFLDFMPLDLQVNYYIANLQHRFKYTPAGIRYNMVRRPGLRIGKDEPRKDYLARIDEDITKRPEWYFQRFDLELTQEDLDTAKSRAGACLDQFYTWYKATDRHTRCMNWNSAQCEGKYGTCPNLPICSRGDYSGHYVRDVPSPELKKETP